MLLGVTCCTSYTDKRDDTFLYTDDYSRTVEVPQHPLRVVSLSPAVTEMVYALHADSLLVGRTDFCNYPDEVVAIPSVGGISNLNVERVVSLKPDVVISGSMVTQRAVEQLEKLGVPVVCVLEKRCYNGLYDNISAIGRLIGCSDEAAALCRTLQEQLQMLVETVNNVDSLPALYYVIGFGSGGNFTAGGNSYINDIISYSGCRNLAADIEGWSYSLECLIAQDPDYVLIRREDSAAFCSMHPYSMLSAVRQHRVIAIESGWIDIQSPRNILAIQYIRNAVWQ